jgi:hypothetical protein
VARDVLAVPRRAPGLASQCYADNVVMALRRLCATGEPLMALSDPAWSAMVLGDTGRAARMKPATPLLAPTTGDSASTGDGNGRLARAAGWE